MSAAKSLLERYLGVPPGDPGQGTSWKFDYSVPWPSGWPAWSVLLAAMAIVVCVILVYRRDAQRSSFGLRVVLVTLRLTLIALVLVFLSGLTLYVDRTGLPVIALLLDVSSSMALEDQYTDKHDRAEVNKLRNELKQQPPNRFNLARALLTEDDGAFLKKLVRSHKLRIDRFSETIVPVGKGEYRQPDEIDDLLLTLDTLKAEGRQTRPGPAVRKILNDLRGSPPSAILVLSDGITTTSPTDKLSSAVELARSQLVPIFAVGIGSEDPARDLQLYDVLVDNVAFVGDSLVFSAKLRGHGFAGRPVLVELAERDSAAILASKSFTIPADEKPTTIELTHTPAAEGEFDYTLRVAPLPDETNVDNNQATRHVSVRQERFRVLLVDSRPRYEFRRIKTILEREKSVDLHTILQDADVDYVLEDRTALNHFPVKREELFRYDVIIFGDADPRYLNSSLLENLSYFVSDAGGGVIVIAGDQFTPLAYQGTPLDVLLPVELEGARLPPAHQPLIESFRPELTIEGSKGSSLFHFASTELEQSTIWDGLSPLNWLLEVPELRPGGVSFAVHPTQKGQAGKLPVISMRRFGAGRVLFHATDELWKWRPYDARYWVHAVRYLSRSKLLGRDRSAELSVDRLVYERGETVHLRVRFLDERLAPTSDRGVEVMVERRGGTQRPVQLARLPQAPAVFEGEFDRATKGSYHAWIRTPSFSEAPPSTDFRVEVPHSELKNRSLDRADLVQTTKSTLGKYFSIASAKQIPNEIPAGHPIPLDTQDPILLWNRWELLMLFTLLVLSEWLLRKRCRLV